MLRGGERPERLIEPVATLGHPSGAPVLRMTIERAGDAMPSEILRALVGDPLPVGIDARRANEREPQRVVVGLVPAVAAVVENGDAIGARGVG